MAVVEIACFRYRSMPTRQMEPNMSGFRVARCGAEGICNLYNIYITHVHLNLARQEGQYYMGVVPPKSYLRWFSNLFKRLIKEAL